VVLLAARNYDEDYRTLQSEMKRLDAEVPSTIEQMNLCRGLIEQTSIPDVAGIIAEVLQEPRSCGRRGRRGEHRH
jgi:hypothetical protein